MDSGERFKKWTFRESDLIDLSPQKVKELIIKCFCQAQNLGEKPTTNFVRAAFLATDGDFENPTVDNLSKAVEFLARRAIAWKTPMEIVNHNKEQLLKVIEMLKKGTTFA